MAFPKKTVPSTPKAAVQVPAVPAIAAAPAAPAHSEAKGSGTAKPRPISPIGVTQDAIAKRAYEIYAGRGYAPGNPDEDWREAERQLRAGL